MSVALSHFSYGSQVKQAISYIYVFSIQSQPLAWHPTFCIYSGLPHGQGYREGFAGMPDSEGDSANESPPASAEPDQATAPAAPMKGINAARQDATLRMDAKQEAVLDRDDTPPGSHEAAGGSVNNEVGRYHP